MLGSVTNVFALCGSVIGTGGNLVWSPALFVVGNRLLLKVLVVVVLMVSVCLSSLLRFGGLLRSRGREVVTIWVVAQM